MCELSLKKMYVYILCGKKSVILICMNYIYIQNPTKLSIQYIIFTKKYI